MKKILLLLLLSVNVQAWAVPAPKVLLPQPQKVRFGEGRLSLESLTVCLPSNPAAEDRFAARELKKILSESAVREVAVIEGESRWKSSSADSNEQDDITTIEEAQ